MLIISGCATSTDRCVNYSISSNNEAWSPTHFYQKESNLIIEIPKTINSDFAPELEIEDTEFDQPYKVSYTYDEVAHQYTLKDNYDKYIMYRTTPDGLAKDKVYISCNRKK